MVGVCDVATPPMIRAIFASTDARGPAAQTLPVIAPTRRVTVGFSLANESVASYVTL
jgi:hypothetical protein